MHYLFVLNWNQTLAHFASYATKEEAKGAAYYWYNCTDSQGRRSYRVFLADQEYGKIRTA